MRPALAAAAVLACCLPHVYFWPGGGVLTFADRPAYSWGQPAPVKVAPP